jgi:hypothetical protein
MLRRSVFFLAILAHAAVTRVEITQRADYQANANYEEITGKIYFAVDPNLPANKIIVDVDRAPRNAQGLVEFSADLYVLKPKIRRNPTVPRCLKYRTAAEKGCSAPST